MCYSLRSAHWIFDAFHICHIFCSFIRSILIVCIHGTKFFFLSLCLFVWWIYYIYILYTQFSLCVSVCVCALHTVFENYLQHALKCVPSLYINLVALPSQLVFPSCMSCANACALPLSHFSPSLVIIMHIIMTPLLVPPTIFAHSIFFLWLLDTS